MGLVITGASGFVGSQLVERWLGCSDLPLTLGARALAAQWPGGAVNLGTSKNPSPFPV